MKLYYTKGVCSLAVRIILNETNSRFEAEAVDLKTKQTAADKNFLAINPKGAVPALELDNGEILTEVAVILQYIAEKNKATDLLPQSSDFKHYRVLEWLNYIATEIHKGFGPLVNPAVDQNLKEQVFIPILNRKLEYINNLLANQPYLLGNDFTLPDAYLFVTLRWAKNFHVDLVKFPAITAYMTNLNTRSSILQSLKEESNSDK
jgi:glutathione S-transferase